MMWQNFTKGRYLLIKIRIKINLMLSLKKDLELLKNNSHKYKTVTIRR